MDCNLCPLRKHTSNTVHGYGNLKAKVMLIGEAAGTAETATGKPFQGRGGNLLNRILESAQFEREELFISNILHCQPPNNNIIHTFTLLYVKHCCEKAQLTEAIQTPVLPQ